MSSEFSSYWCLDSNKDDISKSECNDYQVESQNFNFFPIQNYKNPNNITTEQGKWLHDSLLLINNINFKKECNNLNIKKPNTTIELKIQDNNNLSPNIINNYPFVILNQSFKKAINSNEKLKEDLFVGKKYGRKKKGDNSIGKHNKYSNDNIRRKIKHIVLKNFVSFFNEKIKLIYNGDIGENIYKKELLSLNKEVKWESSVRFNQILLKRTLKDIYSDNITTRFTNFPKDHNINLIQKLVNEKDEEKRKYFIKLFNLTFLDCLNHFRGSAFINELNGMKCFNDVQKDFNDDQEYKTILEYHINNFDKTLKILKPRKPKRKNRENDENENN